MKFEITGTPFPVVECSLERGEEMVTEGGSMVWMSNDIEMHTTGAGGLGRLFSGESIFKNIYTARTDGSYIAFGASFPGRIVALDLRNGSWIFQKGSFLASESSVVLSTYFNKKLGSGLFGGEGFIMQKLSGDGIAFVEIDGALVERQLGRGEQIIVDTGNVAGFTEGVTMDIVPVKGLKNKLLGGEGLFNTVLTGPGTVWLQTMTIPNLAKSLIPYLPVSTNNN